MTATNGSSANGNNGNGFHTPPQPRAEWLARRKAENKDGNFSQMHYARNGVTTEEMEFVAAREKLLPIWCATKSPADA